MRKIQLPQNQGREILLKDTASQVGFKNCKTNMKYNDHSIFKLRGKHDKKKLQQEYPRTV